MIVHPAFVHKCYAPLPQIVQSFLNFSPIEPGGTLLPDRRRRPRRPNFSCYCHAGGRGFESRHSRQFPSLYPSVNVLENISTEGHFYGKRVFRPHELAWALAYPKISVGRIRSVDKKRYHRSRQYEGVAKL